MLKLLLSAPRRFLKSFGYCRDGVESTWRKEDSFRLEALAFAVVLVSLMFSGWPLWKCLVLVAGFLLIPLVEIVNSAIEDICDGISREHRPFIKDAKDKGALAVLMAIIINAVLLAALLII